MFEHILTDDFINHKIKNKLHDPWKNTKFEGYKFLSPASKGAFGESFVELFLKQKGFQVSSRVKKSHDRIINGHKVEIKFSLSKNKKFVLNHFSKEKDWSRAIFCCVYDVDKLLMYWFTREDFLSLLEKGEIFKNQQGGKSINNDDYMCNQKILQSSIIKDITEW
jgi:hypothetical protein